MVIEMGYWLPKNPIENKSKKKYFETFNAEIFFYIKAKAIGKSFFFLIVFEISFR